MGKIYYDIPRIKGEIPLIVLLFFFWLFAGTFIYPYGIIWNLVSLLVLVGVYLGLKGAGVPFLNKKYYVLADETGIAYRLGLFGKETKLIWELIEHTEVLMYEINFTLKSNGAVNSMPLSVLKEVEQDELKKFVYQSYQAHKAKL